MGSGDSPLGAEVVPNTRLGGELLTRPRTPRKQTERGNGGSGAILAGFSRMRQIEPPIATATPPLISTSRLARIGKDRAEAAPTSSQPVRLQSPDHHFWAHRVLRSDATNDLEGPSPALAAAPSRWFIVDVSANPLGNQLE